jgi:preprotein translocase subunit SecD
LASPASVTATFGYNYLIIGLIAAVIVIIVIGLFLVLRRRRP